MLVEDASDNFVFLEKSKEYELGLKYGIRL
jgi:hypothetical protein